MTTDFGDGGGVNPQIAYHNSFGGLVNHGQCYSDPLEIKTGDYREELGKSFLEMRGIEGKAVTATSGGTGTAGYAMIPIYVDPRIVDITRKYTPLVEIIPRVANMGTTADFNRLETKASAVFAGEDAALSEQTDTYDRSSHPIKYLYSVGKVTGPSQAAYPSYILGGFTQSAAPTAKQLDVVVKTRALRELEENAIVTGSTGTTSTWFDGYQQQIGTTNTVDKNTAAVSLDDLYTAVQYAFDDAGRPNIAPCGSSVFTDIANLMIDQFRYGPKDLTAGKLPWGYETIQINTMVGQIPILPSMYESNVSGSKAIYFIDLNETEMRVLQDVTYEELAKTNDSEKFMLKVYEALVLKAPEFCASVTEIST